MKGLLTQLTHVYCLVVSSFFIKMYFPYSGLGLNKRNGSDVDSTNLESLFSQLGFKVTSMVNAKLKEMVQKIDEFTDLDDHLMSQMCVVVVSTHGDEGGIMYATDRPVGQIILFFTHKRI